MSPVVSSSARARAWRRRWVCSDHRGPRQESGNSSFRMNAVPAAMSHISQDVSTEVLGRHKALLSCGGLLSSQEILRRDLEVSLPAHYCSLMAIRVFFPSHS